MISACDPICKTLSAPVEPGGAERLPEAAVEPARHISPVVAHELNNLLTVIQGYADQLLFKHAQNPALEPRLKLISEAARRAATVVRDARASARVAPAQQNLPPSLPPASAA